MANINEGHSAYEILIPILSVVLGLGAVMLGMALDYFKKREIFKLHHTERLAAIEKGIEVPPLPPEFFQNSSRRRITPADGLTRGLRWLALGAALTAVIYFQPGLHLPTNDCQTIAAPLSPWWGLLPTAMGVYNLLAYALVGRHQVKGGAGT